MADLTLGITAKDNASDALKKIGKAVIELGKDSVKSFMESQQAEAKLDSALKQLGYNTERLGPVFRNQASAFQSALGVSDELILSMQSLMLRYGTAPKDIGGATQAILDYAAATGQDAQSATQQLLRAVEGGGKSLSKMGIDIKETGDKSRDLGLAVDALAKKFGGAAAANADTLAGRMAKMDEQVDELKTSFGGFIVEIETKTGIIDKLTEALKGARLMLSDDGTGSAAEKRGEEWDRLKKQVGAVGAVLNQLRKDEAAATAAGRTGGLGGADILREQITEQEALYKKATAALLEFEGKRAQARDAELGVTKEGQSPDAAANNISGARAKELEKASEDLSDHVKKDLATYAKGQRDQTAALTAEIEARREERDNAAAQEIFAANFNAQKEKEALATKLAEQRQLIAAEAEKTRAETEAAYAQAGAAIGVALVGALSNEIQKLKAGGEFDLANILKAALPIVGGIIGSSFGPAGTALGGALGGLAGSIFHDGGYVGELPRHHSGSWIGADERAAILQTGERVVSRAEIAGLGGPRGAERAIRGGGTNVYISALDPRSFQEYLGDEGGGGFARTLRQGRGELAQIFRRRK